MSLRADWKAAKKKVKTEDWEKLVKFKDGLGPQLDKCSALATKMKGVSSWEVEKVLASLATAIDEAEKIVTRYTKDVGKSALEASDKKLLEGALDGIAKGLKEISASTDKMLEKILSFVSEAAIYGDL